MKVSLIIPYYGDRRKQLERSLPFLENQTYPDYEIILVDDGSRGGLPIMGDKVKIVKLRDSTAHIRSANMSTRAGVFASSGDFIIITHPEILIPYDAIEKMITIGNMDRRNGPIQFHLTTEQVAYLSKISGWENNFDLIKNVPEFMNTMTPWGYPNLNTHEHRNHFSFTGSTRERFIEYMIPATDEWGMEDGWVHKKELAAGEPSVPVDIEIYHQEHPREYGADTELSESVRIKRIRQGEQY